MAEFTKRERQELRRLAAKAFESEARTLLEQFDAAFDEWRSTKLGSAELLDVVHAFDQHECRDLRSIYRDLPESQLVARGVARGFLEATDVQAELLAKLRLRIEDYSQ